MREPRLTLTDKAETLPFYASSPESGREHETFTIEREITVQGRHWLLHAECMPVMAELPSRWLPGVNVLVVNDSEINLEVVCQVLKRKGADVTAVGSGADALECLRANPHTFDAVLMDLQMSDMDGLEATRRIREDYGLHTLPIIKLTAGALAEKNVSHWKQV